MELSDEYTDSRVGLELEREALDMCIFLSEDELYQDNNREMVEINRGLCIFSTRNGVTGFSKVAIPTLTPLLDRNSQNDSTRLVLETKEVAQELENQIQHKNSKKRQRKSRIQQ